MVMMSIRSPRSGSTLRRLAVPAACLVVLIAGATVRPSAQPKAGRVVLYAGLGPELIQYDVDVEGATLARRASVMLPANVQEAWRHPSKPILYVAWSDRAPGTGMPGGSRHGLTAFTIDVDSGALRIHGTPATLASRAIHLTVDGRGEHVLVAYNEPAGLTVHRLRADGTIGAEVEQRARLDLGIYPHHVRVDPSGANVLVMSRGNNPTSAKAEEPGSIRVLGYDNGLLANRQTVAPGGGIGFQVRHADFHPTRPWVYVTLERQNTLQMFERNTDGTLHEAPSFSKATLLDPARVRPGQTTSTIRVHPNGRFVYLGNRSAGTTSDGGQAVFAGGENSIAVFAIDQTTGEPTLIQNADTRGFTPRTFALDRSGRVLVVANQVAMAVRDGNAVKTVPAGLTVFRVQSDGTLAFASTHVVESRGDTALFWTGMVEVP
jgi:6-phosphogluconolactonase